MSEPVADASNIGSIVSQYAKFTDFYQAGDELGFHSLWLTRCVFQPDWPDKGGAVGGRYASASAPTVNTDPPLTVLASAVSATSRIRLGMGLAWNDMKDPVALASELARLDRLSGGRLVLGVSQGDWPDERPRGSTMWARRGARAEELIMLLKRLWREDEVSFHGNHFRFENATIPERPARSEGIPILAGGASLASIRLAATLADGWVHPSGGIPEQLLLFSSTVKYLALEAGRDPEALDLEKIIYLVVDNDKTQAWRRLSILQQFYGRGYNVNQ